MKYDLVFYDGDCGMCHGWVKVLLRTDKDGKQFRFAPIGSRAFQKANLEIKEDTVVVQALGGRVLIKWAAVKYLLGRMGGGWKILGWALSWTPRWLGDWGYGMAVRFRGKIWAKPEGDCPVVEETLRERFLL